MSKAAWIAASGNHLSMMIGCHGRRLAAHLDERLAMAEISDRRRRDIKRQH